MKNKYVLVIALFLVACNSTQTEVTNNKNQEAMASFVNAHTISVTLESDKVRFVTDSKLIPVSHTAAVNEPFLVGIGEQLMIATDEHSSTEFTYRGVRDSSALFGYETKFDQRSFGKNLISIDRGEILVRFRTGTAPLVQTSREKP